MKILSIILYLLAAFSTFGVLVNISQRKELGNRPLMIVLPIVCCVVFSLLAYNTWPDDPTEKKVNEQYVKAETPAKPKRREFNSERHLSEAYVVSHEFIERYLLSPGSSKYPFEAPNEVTKYSGDSIYTVESYVDSQNGFGALLRTQYSAKVKYNGSDKWQLQKLYLDGKEME